jgi:hypothetical protein
MFSHQQVSHNRLDRQCSYNVTLRCVRATIVAVEKQLVLHILSVCVGSLRYLAWNAQAPYFLLWHDFRKKKVIENKMRVLILYTTFVWKFSNSKKKLVRYDQKCILDLKQIVRYSCPILMKLETYCQIVAKCWNKILWKSVQWEPHCSMRTDRRKDGQTARHDEANSHFSQFCKRAWNLCSTIYSADSDFKFEVQVILVWCKIC